MSRIATRTEAKVLSFAAVADRGREWWARLAASAFVLAVLTSRASAQPAPPFLDLAPGFASKIVNAVPGGTAVRFAFDIDDARLQAEIVRLVSAGGVRVADGGDATVVTAACRANLRERVCAAAIGRSDDRRVVIETRDLAAGTSGRAPIVAIELTPIYSQQSAMLDIADAGQQLLVLTPDAISLIDRAAGGRIVASATVGTRRVWPRDLRGMLRVNGGSFEAFLPGVTCRGTVAPLTAVCSDENESWPIGLENNGVAPSRNTFATPEGLTFYEAAPLAGGRFLVIGEQGVLTFL